MNQSNNQPADRPLPSTEGSWEKSLNEQFFAGIPMEEMGTNQVNEAELQLFIRKTITSELARREGEVYDRVFEHTKDLSIQVGQSDDDDMWKDGYATAIADVWQILPDSRKLPNPNQK